MWLTAPEGLFPQELAADVRLILDSISDGVYGVDASGKIVLVNAAASRILGYPPQELIGRVPHEVMHHSRPDGSPFPREECALSIAAAEGRVFTSDQDVFWRRDGSSFPVEYESRPMVRDGRIIGFVVTFRDITARRRNEERVRELLREQFAKSRAELQYAQLRDVLAQTPAVVCVTRGPRHLIETANARFSEIVGQRDVVGLTIREACADIDPGLLSLMDLAFESGEAARGVDQPATVQTASGPEERFYDFTCQPLADESGFVYGLMLHAVDVTAAVRTRQQLETRTAELARAAASLARTNSELDAFAYAASHDLRAPLRGIANLAQWIEEDLSASTDLKAETREMLELMRSRMHRMERLIEGILAYSRAGRVTERSVEIDTRRMLDDVLDLLPIPPDAEIDISDALPVIVSPVAPLQQVFINLVGNALKYNAAPRPHVTVTAADAGEFVEFAVRDNGPGIAPEYHERIWGIFQTLEARDKVEGTGIGLALVKKLVEEQGGRAWVESVPGAGATFKFLWPREIGGTSHDNEV